MNRRAFLQRSGGLATLAGLAGCLGSAGSDTEPADSDGKQTDGTTHSTTDDSTTDSERRFSGVRSEEDEPFRTISVGSRDEVAFPENNKPRGLRVWNAADEAREIDLQVSRGATILVDRTVEFAADAYLTVTLNEPADYGIAVGLADGTSTTFGVERTSFDCNTTGTDVGVMPDGRVETMSMSTAMGCPSSEVASADLSVGQGTCGEENGASVAFDAESVRVDGTVRTSTPNRDLELADAGYDAETGALTVRVRATEGDDGEMGVQCVGQIPYEATIGFDYDLPDTVVVVHESMDETTEVARADRGSKEN
ncbi:hypothetical protein [Halorussus ruber]|uniref:hypothetical protein n=1 Tax=Halorussus ruber TaxID=1126238 RepID=UPI001092BA0E|nr:hypothetical protein [Halorussus ruber]